jgi:hypothetical protein
MSLYFKSLDVRVINLHSLLHLGEAIKTQQMLSSKIYLSCDDHLYPIWYLIEINLKKVDSNGSSMGIIIVISYKMADKAFCWDV